MKTNQSQLEYLFSRKKSYDLKYGILEDIIKNLDKNKRVIELFGGAGNSEIEKWEKLNYNWREILK